MGVLIWPLRFHARASTTSRAAKAVSKSAVTPPLTAVSVESRADHHSAGIASLCHHFDTVQAPAPGISEAIASREGQSSIIFWNEVKSDMAPVLGQLVLNCKDILALDAKKLIGHTVRMADSDVKAQYEQEFIERVKAARIATGKKQWQVAELMGIKQDQYKHYEVTTGNGRVIPHHLIGRFCLICNIDPNWLLTGKGTKPMQPPHVVETEPDSVPKSKKAKRSKRAA